MIAITNRTVDGRPPREPHDYTVQINAGPVIATFKHRRTMPLSACLYAAAHAVAQAEIAGTTENPFKDHVIEPEEQSE